MFFVLLFLFDKALDCSLILFISSNKIFACSVVLDAQTISTPPLDKKNSAKSIAAIKVVLPFFLAMSNNTSLNRLRPVLAILKPYATSRTAFSQSSKIKGIPLKGLLVCLQNVSIKSILMFPGLG